MGNKNFVVLFITFILSVLLIVLVIKDKSPHSVLENRDLATHVPVSLSAWFDGNFQDNLEDVLADQFVFRTFWVNQYNKLQFNLNVLTLSSLQRLNLDEKTPNQTQQTSLSNETEKPSDVTEVTETTQQEETTEASNPNQNPLDDSAYMDNYVEDEFNDDYDENRNDVSVMPINGQVNLVTLNGEKRLVKAARNLDAGTIESIQKKIYDINYLIDDVAPSDLYVYFALSPIDSEFIYPNANFKTISTNVNKLEVPFDYFKMDRVADIQRYFYRTDHHWNAAGAFRGYRDIIRLMFGDDEKVFRPQEIYNFDWVDFYGSNARLIAYSVDTGADDLTAMRFDLPDYKITIDDKTKNSANNLSEYTEQQKQYEKGFDHYNNLYLGRRSFIEFNSDREDLGNALIISDSMSNPIRELIAGHFNKTFFVNMSMYYESEGEFDIAKFVQENNITKTLFFVTLDSYMPNGDLEYINSFD